INPAARIIVAEDRIRPDKSEVVRLIGDNRKIRSLTAWEPVYEMDAGLRNTINWFREPQNRSEEHTSELQSRFDIVCRLLLDKKNGKQSASRPPSQATSVHHSHRRTASTVRRPDRRRRC